MAAAPSALLRPDLSHSGREPMDTIELQAAAAAARVAADDALAHAGRIDHLVHLAGEDAGRSMRGLADATRQHAESLDAAAAFLARCAAGGVAIVKQADGAGAVVVGDEQHDAAKPEPLKVVPRWLPRFMRRAA